MKHVFFVFESTFLPSSFIRPWLFVQKHFHLLICNNRPLRAEVPVWAFCNVIHSDASSNYTAITPKCQVLTVENVTSGFGTIISSTWVWYLLPELVLRFESVSQSQKSKSTLLSIFQFVCTDREIEIPFPTIPNTKTNIYINMYTNMYIPIHNQQTVDS